jgi:hypothetical protein
MAVIDADLATLDPLEVVTLPPGVWCEFRLDDDGGDGRADERAAMIRVKNATFAAWDRAALLCERRRHTAGLVPGPWLGRLRELEGQYRQAVGTLVHLLEEIGGEL